MNEFILMSLFTEVKMGSNRVLEKMNDQITKQDEKRRAPAPQFQALRHHLNQGGRQHESRAQCDKVTKIPPFPMALHNDCAAKNIGGGGGQAEQNANENGAHVRMARMIPGEVTTD